jgi:hypothetical protein
LNDIDEHRVSTLTLLLDVLDQEIEVLNRRLIKSGANHFAVARFDALNYISQTCFVELEAESTAIDSSVDNVMARLSHFNSRLDSLVSEFVDLDDSLSRPRRTRERTKQIVSEIKSDAAFSKDKRQGWRPRLPDEAHVALEAETIVPESVHFDTAEAEADIVPLVLSGVFMKRRARI